MNILRAVRLHHWTKNLLLFVPLVTSHQLLELDLQLNMWIAFLSFSLCASSVYLLNDISDLDHDRNHPVKQHRPLASGRMTLGAYKMLALGLLAVSILLSLLLNSGFQIMLAIYFLFALTYSMKLKKIYFLDIIFLALFYEIRVFTGIALTGIQISGWLLGFSFCVFMTLAFLKRYQDLKVLKEKKLTEWRGYFFKDRERIRSMALVSVTMSIPLFALYLYSKEVASIYREPPVLWLFLPVYLACVGRMWFLAGRENSNRDFMLHVLGDVPLYMLVAVATLIFSAAKLGFWIL